MAGLTDFFRFMRPLPAKISDKPDLVLTGLKEFAGSAGSHEYIFKNGKYEYNCVIEYASHPDSLPMALEVYKEGELILTQAVITEEY